MAFVTPAPPRASVESSGAEACNLPSGELTFLFSDIESSTRTWELHPDAMPAALARHQAAVRAAVAQYGGMVVKDTGDGLFAVFPSARAGVMAAVRAQRDLKTLTWQQTGPLRARMGLHTAEAEPEHGDYHGVPVNRCARIMGVAHGGQVLVSEAAYHGLAADPPPEVSFLDLGRHRLRDLSVAVQLLQVMHRDLDAEFPPLRSLDVLPNNLPAVPSSLVGRSQELAEIAGLLTRTRLLTLTGAGGVGKTRVALQLAADQAETFSDGVWVVDLAGLGEPDLVPQAVASALRVAEQPGRSWVESVLWFLRNRRVLLLLDNCEHLLTAVASLTELVLERCPGATVVATSREALHTPGEVAWRVPSLGLPNGAGTSDAERLFLQRASEADPRYRPVGADRDAVAQICLRLDGLPLAIELAAARVRVLSATEIADRLDDRFRLLTGGSRISMPRQRTLEAAVAWSYDLLEQRQRRLFERLSVFAGGFTLSAAEAVCAASPIRSSEVLDLLTDLADRSLVIHEPGTPSRYRLLETMRAYGRDRLLRKGELQGIRNAHLAWVNEFIRTAAPKLEGPQQERWLHILAADLDNIRAALAWSHSGGDVGTGLACASSLFRYWYVRAVREGRLWLDRLLEAAASDTPAKLLAKALYADGSLTAFTGDNEGAGRCHEHALAIYRQMGHRHGEAWALHGLGVAEWGHRKPVAVKARFEQALQIFREIHDPVGIAFSLQFVILWETCYGDLARAARYLEEDERLVREVGMPLLLAHHAEFAALVLWRSTGEARGVSDYLRTAIDLYDRIGSIFCTMHGLESVAFLASHAGRAELAACLLGAVDKLRAESGTPIPVHEHMFYEESSALTLAKLGAERNEAARREGETLTLNEAIHKAREALRTS